MSAPLQPDFTAYGTQVEVMRYMGKELTNSGPAGTGKSRTGLEKLDTFCCYFPGCRTLIARKTRASLTQSTLVTYEREVLRDRFSEKPSKRHVYFHGGDMEYRYPNGSVAVIGGLDKARKIMSSQYDLILIDEGTELTEDDYESLTTRMRNGKASFRQLLLCVNPDSPQHFLIKRRNARKLRMVDAQHTDNPVLFDQAKKEWTERGREYMEILNDLTGTRKLRLKDGIWCMADGMCFVGFEQNTHTFFGWNEDWSLYQKEGSTYDDENPYKTDPPKSWTRTLSIDFGFANPFVCQFWAEDADGRLYLYREIYHTGRTVEQHAEQITRLCEEYDEPEFADIITDHDAEDRATLTHHLRKNWRFARLSTTAAKKDVNTGIDSVVTRLKVQADGRARIFFRRDARVEPDRELEMKHLPTSTIEEIWGYVFDERGKPVKKNDHGCFVAGTMVETATGECAIETIKTGASVLTRDGYKRVRDAGMTEQAARVMRVTCSDGRTFTCTHNHPFYVKGKGFVQADALRYNDALLNVTENGLWRSSSFNRNQNASSACGSTESSTDVTRAPNSSATATTFGAASLTHCAGSVRCTATFGSFITAKFLSVITFIISTAMRSIITSRTSKRYPRANITTNTFQPRDNDKQSLTSRVRQAFLKSYASAQRSGTNQQKVAHGTSDTRAMYIKTHRRLKKYASNATRIMSCMCWVKQFLVSALTPARPVGDARAESMTSRNAARSAAENSRATNTTKSHTAPVYVRSVIAQDTRRPVYNLTVEDAPEYYANGVLVHNCDACRYRVATYDLRPQNTFTMTRFRR